MAERHIYLLAQFDAETNRLLADIAHRFALAGFTGQQTRGIPYHFTLGRFGSGQEAQVLAHAQAACRDIKPFDVHLNHIGLFGLRVLFAAPAMNHELLRLHDALIPHEPAQGIHHWVAHATLLIDEPEAVKAALLIAAEAFSPITAKLESIGVYEFFPARFIENLPLRG